MTMVREHMYDRYEQLRLEGFKHEYCMRLLGLDYWWGDFFKLNYGCRK